MTDGWTDRQTDRPTDILPRHSPRCTYASCGKNYQEKLYTGSQAQRMEIHEDWKELDRHHSQDLKVIDMTREETQYLAVDREE